MWVHNITADRIVESYQNKLHVAATGDQDRP